MMGAAMVMREVVRRLAAEKGELGSGGGVNQRHNLFGRDQIVRLRSGSS